MKKYTGIIIAYIVTFVTLLINKAVLYEMDIEIEYVRYVQLRNANTVCQVIIVLCFIAVVLLAGRYFIFGDEEA